MQTRCKYPIVCHPGKLHVARGLCGSCWQYWNKKHDTSRWHRLQTIVAGHEERKAVAATQWKKLHKDIKRRDPQSYEKGRDKALRDRYGIDLSAYNRLAEKQNGRCAICRRVPPASARNRVTLYVDHCHTTKRVRGLLCARCNNFVAIVDRDKSEAGLIERLTAYVLETEMK